MESPPPPSLPELDSYRAYLIVLARGGIPASMQARLDASDIVQETLLEAHRKREQFRGGEEPKVLAAWLRQLLACNLMDALRTQRRGLRDVRREQSFQPAVEDTAMGLDQLLVANDSSPSQRVDREFRVLRVAAAIEDLPEHQRAAILMRYCQQATVEQIAVQLDKTKTAVAGLLKRGLATLRERLMEIDS